MNSKDRLFEMKFDRLHKHRTFPRRFAIVVDGRLLIGHQSTHQQAGAQKYRKLIRILQACKRS